MHPLVENCFTTGRLAFTKAARLPALLPDIDVFYLSTITGRFSRRAKWHEYSGKHFTAFTPAIWALAAPDGVAPPNDQC